MKNKLIGVGIFVLVATMMFLLSELIVRSIYADETVLFPRYHTDATYGEYTIRRIRPNSRFRHKSIDGTWEFVTNSQGFRNYEDFDFEKPDGKVRIMSLGDSHTQGYEVRQDYTFSAVAERYLHHSGISAQVINTGVSGFGTAEQLVLLQNEGIKYNPDVVVLGFFGNDLEDNIKTGLFKLDEEGKLVENSRIHVPGVRVQNIIYSAPGIKWLGENSYFYSLLFNTTWDFFKQRLARSTGEQVTEYAVPQKDDFSSYEIELAAELLKRLYAVSVANDIKLIIVDIPIHGHDRGISTSFPEQLRPVAEQFSHAFIPSGPLLGEYAGVAELHAPHGHRHISEFTHTLIGVAVARAIRDLMPAGGDSVVETGAGD